MPAIASIADINADCAVDEDDLLLVIFEWGNPDSLADLDQNGTVDVNDLLLVLNNWSL